MRALRYGQILASFKNGQYSESMPGSSKHIYTAIITSSVKPRQLIDSLISLRCRMEFDPNLIVASRTRRKQKIGTNPTWVARMTFSRVLISTIPILTAIAVKASRNLYEYTLLILYWCHRGCINFSISIYHACMMSSTYAGQVLFAEQPAGREIMNLVDGVARNRDAFITQILCEEVDRHH
jgi:hypothetical protein